MFIILSWDLTSFYYLNKRSSWKNRLFWLLENKGQLNFFCFHSSGSFCCVREDSKSDWNVIVDYFWLEWGRKELLTKKVSTDHTHIVKKIWKKFIKTVGWRTCRIVGLSKTWVCLEYSSVLSKCQVTCKILPPFFIGLNTL